MIPAETVQKQVPAATATIGLPFTYALTIPSMQFPVGAASPNDLGSIVVSDDLTTTGAALTLVSLNAYYKGSGTAVPINNLGLLLAAEEFLILRHERLMAAQSPGHQSPARAPGVAAYFALHIS